MEVICRKAVEEDIQTLYDIIQGYAEKGIMLPRSKETLKHQLDTFVVAQYGEELVGCGSLCRLGSDLVEIRSLGVTSGYKGQGIGRKLVSYLVDEAYQLGISNVMALTYEVEFFIKNEFRVVEKEIFPEKVWKDCIHCKKQHCCDEIAVLRKLDIPLHLTNSSEEGMLISLVK